VHRAKIFVRPYPRPSWCPPPAHDTTGHSFCRVLPVSLFPEGNTANAPTVPVGSEKWIENRAVAQPAFFTLRESRPTSEPIILLIDEGLRPIGDIVEYNGPIEGTDDLWGDSELEEKTELISDLAIASFDPSVRPNVKLESVCPHHGRTCKKGLCDWRAKYEKQKERENGYPTGPSNTKNYKPRNGRDNGGSRSGTQTSTKAETTDPPRVGRPGGSTAPPSNAWGRGPPVFTPNRPSASTSTPGQGNGTGRGGQPAWAPARGRGRKPT